MSRQCSSYLPPPVGPAALLPAFHKCSRELARAGPPGASEPRRRVEALQCLHGKKLALDTEEDGVVDRFGPPTARKLAPRSAVDPVGASMPTHCDRFATPCSRTNRLRANFDRVRRREHRWTFSGERRSGRLHRLPTGPVHFFGSAAAAIARMSLISRYSVRGKSVKDSKPRWA